MNVFRLALPLALIPAFAADEVAFRPAANSSVAKELAIDVELGLGEVHASINGNDLPPEMLGASADEKLLVKLVLEVTEKYVAAKDGRPLDLLRTFDDVSVKVDVGGESESTEGAKELKGKTVRFLWNEDEKRYDKSWHESSGDDAQLAELSEDMDLRCLLPSKSVSEGDTWEVAGEKLAPLFMPGGFASGDKDEDDSAVIEEEIRTQLASFVKDFKVLCKYVGKREDGDVKTAEVHFTFEGAPKLDMGSVIEKLAQAQGNTEAGDVTATVGATIKGEGNLQWNVAAGRVHAFDMQSDLDLAVEVNADIDEEGESFKLDIDAAASGTVTWKMSAK